jgi:hypothetical protein
MQFELPEYDASGRLVVDITLQIKAAHGFTHIF